MLENRIEISLLGPVEIIRNGRNVDGFESRKARALFCYLVATQQSVLRANIVDIFWGDKPEERGRSNLSRVLHNNAALLPDTVVYSRNSVQFVRNASTVADITYFHELVSRNDLDSLVKAVSLYRGEFMADIAVEGCPEFDTWLTTERELWQQRIVNVLSQLVSQHRAIGEYGEGLKHAHRLLELDPWREETYREIMLMHSLTGERSAALAQYEKCSRILLADLGIKPSAETTALYYRIRSGEARQKGLPTTVSIYRLATSKITQLVQQSEGSPLHRTNVTKRVNSQEYEQKRLLHSSRRFGDGNLDSNSVITYPATDYESEFSQIIERLSDPRCRLLTLLSPNQEIRRQLLYQVATSSMLAFRDGVSWIANRNSNTSSLLVDIADSLQLFLDDSDRHLLEYKVDTAVTWLFKCLRSMELLLVIHDTERYSADTLLIDAIVRRAPQTKILTGAQRPLGIMSEWFFDV